MLDERRAAEEVAQLHDDEQQKERVEESQCHDKRRNTGGDIVQLGSRNWPADETPAKPAGGERAPEEDEKRMLHDTGCVECKEILEHVRKHWIGGGEQRGEDHEQRRRDDDTGQHAAQVAQTTLAWHLVPVDVPPYQYQSTDDATD